MIKPINKDPLFLSIPSIEATAMDLQVEQDLIDTLKFHANECVGMAANMIGYSKRIIIFFDETTKSYCTMFNPKIISCKNEYSTMEGCLSLPGERPTKRYRTISVQYQNNKFQLKTKTYHDFTAQIIQHEIDMTNGILI